MTISSLIVKFEWEHFFEVLPKSRDSGPVSQIGQKLKPTEAWDGEDRHNGEIASFHLNRILKFNRAPLVAGRKINLTEEILPVATDRLKKTFETYENNTCFYGECHYCKPSYRACAKVCPYTYSM